jgi:sulfur carrier protein
MEITLNGTPTELPDAATIGELLARAGLVERRVAVEVEGAIVPRSAHGTYVLRPGDRVEIVHALGGG